MHLTYLLAMLFITDHFHLVRRLVAVSLLAPCAGFGDDVEVSIFV